MDNQLTLGRVHIVEWLNAGDDETGQKLFAELQSMGAASQPQVEVDFYQIDTTRELLGLLSSFTEASRRESALEARDRAPARESAAQLYRLLDQTNYRKSVDQLLALLQVLNCDGDLVA